MTAGARAEIQTEIYVIEGKEESLLGQEDAEALGIITIRTDSRTGVRPTKEAMPEREATANSRRCPRQGEPEEEGDKPASSKEDRRPRRQGDPAHGEEGANGSGGSRSQPTKNYGETGRGQGPGQAPKGEGHQAEARIDQERAHSARHKD